MLLAPLSAGVAEGFAFTPIPGEVADTLTIDPGLAIDGQGRLLLVTDKQVLTLDQIVSMAGANIAQASPTTPIAIRVCLALDDSLAGLDPCDPYRPAAIEERATLLLQTEDAATVLTQIVNQFQNPNCVPAWSDLDNANSGAPCCVTLGHVLITSPTAMTATTFFRQGVCPRFNVIRNTDGSPSIFLNQIEFDGSAFGVPSLDEPGVGIPVATVFGPKAVAFGGDAYFFKKALFADAGGLNVQATHVAPFGAKYKAGTVAASDPRVFSFAGGSGPADATELAAGFGGVASVPCEVVASSFGPVTIAGVPLAVSASTAGTAVVRVVRTNAADQVIGLSAGAEYPHPTNPSKQIVPVALGGLVQVTVAVDSGGLDVGTPLVVNDQDTLAKAGTGLIVARAAQSVLAGTPGSYKLYAWILQAGA